MISAVLPTLASSFVPGPACQIAAFGANFTVTSPAGNVTTTVSLVADLAVAFVIRLQANWPAIGNWLEFGGAEAFGFGSDTRISLASSVPSGCSLAVMARNWPALMSLGLTFCSFWNGVVAVMV